MFMPFALKQINSLPLALVH